MPDRPASGVQRLVSAVHNIVHTGLLTSLAPVLGGRIHFYRVGNAARGA